MNVVMIVVRAVDRAAHARIRASRWPWACSSAACCSCGFQLPAVMQLGLFRWPRWRPAAEGVRRIGKLMLPGIVGSSMAQVSLLLDTQIATVPDHRQRGVAVLRRPAHGISAGRVQHRAGHRDPAGTVAASRGEVAGAFHRHARLGAAARHPAGVAGGGGHAGVRGSADGHHLRLRRVHAARRADGELRADGVFVGTAGLQPGEGAGAGIFRAPGHAARRCASGSSRSAATWR